MASPKAKKVRFDDTPTIYPFQLEPKTEVQSGDYSSAKLAERMEEQNEKILGRWKEEVDSVVVFAGLFTAIGAVFLTGSYKGSAQNPGKETVNLKLIAELFQHLVNISDGIPLRVESVAAERSEPFKQTRSEVMVNLNVTCFFSIIICIGCTAFVTSIQRWARRRVAHIQRGGSPYELARLQAFLFRKPGRFLVRMHRLYLLLGIFMRLSLLFYCVGLVAFIFRIDQKSISKALALGYILGCFLVYAMTMVLPFYFFDCPYGTPFTVLTWRLYHAFMFGFFSTFRGITDLPHSLSTLGSLTHRRVRDPLQWRKMLEERVNKHRRRLSCGRERRVESHPTKALRVMETWTTEKSSDKAQKEVEDFTAWALEFFNSYALLGAEETILPLVSDQSPTNCVFGIRLRHLLTAFTLGCFDPTTDSELRRRCLRECLECLWCSAKAYSQKTAASLPSLVPFPNTNTIHRLQAERDPTVAIMARCFCALIARELAADINSRSSSDYTKLESLSAILGRTRMEVEVLLLQPGAICLTNVVSLVSGVIKAFSTEEVPSNIMSIFRTTSDILLAEDTLISPDVELPQDLVSSFYQTYSNAQQLQAPDWLMRQLCQISERLITVSEERERQGGGHSIFLGQD